MINNNEEIYIAIWFNMKLLDNKELLKIYIEYICFLYKNNSNLVLVDNFDKSNNGLSKILYTIPFIDRKHFDNIEDMMEFLYDTNSILYLFDIQPEDNEANTVLQLAYSILDRENVKQILVSTSIDEDIE